MAKDRTDNSKYESRFGGGFVTGAQYIAELICQRDAAKKKITLPVRFWNLVGWKKAFLLQLRAANSLLKLYSARAIITALGKLPTVYSLRAPWLDPVIQEEQAKLDLLPPVAADTAPTPTPSPAQPEKPREGFVYGKTTLGKLRGLDE